ncbi:polymeric immunoglobulin receptor-like [Fundulus diaphanus]
MSVRLSLFCFFFLCLQGAESCYTADAFSNYKATGENFSFLCIHHSPKTWKIFCKDDCEGENVLIKTREDKAQSGRFSTDYKRELQILKVAITHLTKSDSGQYRCGTGTSLSSASFTEFGLRVTDVMLDETSNPEQKHLSAEPGSSITVACSFPPSGGTKYFCRGPCDEITLVQTDGETAQSGKYSIEYEKRYFKDILLVTITELTQSDSGQYRCYQDTTKNSYIDFNITVTQAVQPLTFTPATIQTSAASYQPAQLQSGITNPPVSFSHYVPLIVGVSLAGIAVLLSASLVASCRRTRRGLKTRGGLNDSVEIIIYENCSAEDPTYQSLNPASKDQIYSELTLDK